MARHTNRAFPAGWRGVWSSVRVCVLAVLVLGGSAAWAHVLHEGVRVDVGHASTQRLGAPGTSRNVVVDEQGHVFVAFYGTNGIWVAHSSDRGATFQATNQVSGAHAECSVAIDQAGNLFVAWMEDGDQVMFSKSTNRLVFSMPRVIGEYAAESVQVAADHPHVYVLPRGGERLFRNGQAGTGAFAEVAVEAERRLYADLVVDPRTHELIVQTDDPCIRYSVSTDRGASFGVRTQTTMRVYHPATAGFFAHGQRYLLVGGRSNVLYRMDMDDHAVTQLGASATRDRGRALVTDHMGNLVDGFMTTTGTFFRVSLNAGETFGPSVRAVGSVASISLGISSLFGDLLVVYEDDGRIWCNVYADHLVCTNIDVRVSGVSLPERIRPGGTVRYRLSVTNASPGVAPGVVVTNELPGPMTYQGGTPGWQHQGGGRLVFDVGDMAPRAGVELVVTASVSTVASGALSNRAAAWPATQDILPENNEVWMSTLVSPALEIINERGICLPPPGVHTNELWAELVLTNLAPYHVGCTQYVLTGWTMTGHDPSSGTSNWFSMTHTNDAVLTWQWGSTNVTFVRDSTAHGSVAGDPAGYYEMGSWVQVEAIPNAHYHFAHWSGEVPEGQASQNPLLLHLDRSRSIQANYSLDTHTLTVNSEHGGVMPWVGTHTYSYGHTRTCWATDPLLLGGGTTQYLCSGWTMTGHEPHSGTGSLFSLTLTNDASLVWGWGQTNVRLVASASPGGHLAGETNAWASRRSTIQVEAVPDPNHVFAGWTGDVPAGQEASPSLSLWMEHTRAIEAHFHGIERHVTVSSKYGTPSPSVGVHAYVHFDLLDAWVDAQVTEGTTQHVCAGWTLTGHTPSSGEANAFSVMVTNDALLTWQWTTNVYLEVATDGPGHVTGAASGWHPLGAQITIEAVPETEQTPFLYWAGSVPGLPTSVNPLTFSLSQAHSVTAHFHHCEAILEVVSEYGSPVPARGQNSITCGATLEASVDEIVEQDGVRYTCLGWSMLGNQPVNGAGHRFDMTLTNDYALLIWLWEETDYYLGIEVAGSGEVGGMSPGWYPLNTPVTLLPLPFAGGAFLRWELDVPPGQDHDDPLNFMLDRSRTVRAVFTEVHRTLEVQSAHGAPDPSGITAHLHGASVSCNVATPVPGGDGIRYECTGWSMTGQQPATGTTASFSIPSHTNNAQLTWLWRTSCYVSVSAAPGSAAGTTSGWYPIGTAVSVEALPPEAHAFTHWTGDVPPGQENQNPLEVTLTEPLSVVAHYGPLDHVLTIDSTHGTAMPPPGSYSHPHATILTNWLEEPLLGGDHTQHVSLGWTMTNHVPHSGSASLMTMMLTNNAHLVWRWQTNVRMHATTDGHGTLDGTAAWHPVGSVCEIIAVPDTGMAFSHWSGDVPPAQANQHPLLLTMDRARSFTGHFERARHRVEIRSPHGHGVPPTGVYTSYWGTIWTNQMSAEQVVPGGTQYVLTGWTLADHDADAQSGVTSVVVTVTNDLQLSWQWSTNVQFSWTHEGEGSVTGGEQVWYPIGSSVSVSALPGEGYYFERWESGAPPGHEEDETVELVMDRARHLHARFSLIVLLDFAIVNATIHSSADRRTVDAHVTIANWGADAGDAGLLTVWGNRSTPADCGETGDDSVEVGILEPGEVRTYTFTNLFPGAGAGLRTGRFFVDSLCNALEAERGNNQFHLDYHYMGPVVKRFSFHAVALEDRVVLRWTEPGKSGMPNDMVRLLVRTDRYPEACDDGDLIYTGSHTRYEHCGLTQGVTYYYGIFVNDGTYYVVPPDW